MEDRMKEQRENRDVSCRSSTKQSNPKAASTPLIEKEKLCRRHNLQICPRGLHQPDSSSTKRTPRDVKHKLNSQGLCAWSFTQGLLYEIQVHYNIWLHN